jgi:hypothetical protein
MHHAASIAPFMLSSSAVLLAPSHRLPLLSRRVPAGYDPSKYKDSFFDDRRMEASAAEIQAEERRSARIGRTEDEKEAEAEARRMAAKEAKKKGRKRGAAALFDD